MAAKFNILKGGSGDAILLSFDNKNILIDGGTVKDYRLFLKKEIEAIKKRGEIIDLVIVTHMDDDHLMGILALLRDVRAKKFPSEIIGELIFQIPPNIETPLSLSNNSDISSSHAKELKEELEQTNVNWREDIVYVPDYPKDGDYSKFSKDNLPQIKIEETKAKLYILSPTRFLLEEYFKKYKKEFISPDIASQSDYKTPLKAFNNFDASIDDSVANGSSIAFLFEYDGENVALFLGDAFSSTIVHGLRILGYSEDNPIAVDYLKLSHHGSRRSTTTELLKYVQTENYIISTKGNRHNLPNKKLIAKILYVRRLLNNDNKVQLYFNYSKDHYSNIITRQDMQDFPFLLAKPIFLKEQNKNGLEIQID